MNSRNFKTLLLILFILAPMLVKSQDFQGKAYYYSKSTMELGRWGATMSEAQKKQIAETSEEQIKQNLYLNLQ